MCKSLFSLMRYPVRSHRGIAPILAALLAIGCVNPPTPSATPSPGFEASGSIVIAPDGARHKVEVVMRDRGSMTYPREQYAQRVGAQAITAFVVDTSGRIEPGTMRFLGETPPASSRRALCDWSRTVRYNAPHVDGRTTRVLLVQPWAFSIGTPQSRPMPNVEGFGAMLRHMTPTDATSWLRHMPQCDGSPLG